MNVMTEIEVPNHTYLELRLVKFTATGIGKNETVTMKADENGLTYTIQSGRTGVRAGRNKALKRTVPMETWDAFFLSKIGAGYTVTKTEELSVKEVKKDGEYQAIRDESVADIVKLLLSAANQVLDEQYSVKVEDISDTMLQKGQDVLNDLAEKGENVSVAEFNNELLQLWTAIPRPAKNLSKLKATAKADFADKLSSEQELLDFLVAALRKNDASYPGGNGTILDANGLLWEPVTDEEKSMLKDKMGSERARYLRAWKVTNKQTENRFAKYIASHPSCQREDGISYLFHGSGTENFWSIITNGLYLNPAGVVISGKAFGHGLYFAPRAKKSIGYTSSSGSYWRSGDCSKGYLAVFKVATGNIYDIYGAGGSSGCKCPDNYEQLQKIQPDADCTWAYNSNVHSNSYLVNDEVIVYREDQATIEYLIEFSA